jgi:hypothetical protein
MKVDFAEFVEWWGEQKKSKAQGFFGSSFMASFKRKGKKPKKKTKLESADGVVGTLFVTVIRAQLDNTDGEVPDPYAWAELKQEGEKSENTYKTRTIEDTENPLCPLPPGAVKRP